MTMSSAAASMLLYLALVATSLLLRERKAYIFGAILIATCLLFIELPDVATYKEHYQLARHTSFENIFSLYNFEPGYVVLVIALSRFLPFEVFYVIVVSLAIHAYLKFYEKSVNKRPYIFAVLFLSVCLYFVAFTLRTTIASMFLAYALSCLKGKKNALAAVLIFLGATFHIVIAPMIILPIVNKFSALISRRYLLFYAIAIALAVIIARHLSLNFLVGANQFIDLKISAYEDANVSSNSLYFGLWILAIFGSCISYRYFDESDRVLAIVAAVNVLLLYPFEFIQGRFMWLTSFLFAYIFAKGTIARIDIGKTGRLVFVLTLPLLSFLRF